MKFPEYFTEDCFKQESKEVLQKKVEALVTAMTNDEKAELLKKEYTNRIRLYRKSVENILKEKEKTEEQKE